MSLAVTVHAKITGRRRAAADHCLRLDLPAGAVRAEDFLRAVTRAEIAAYEGRAQDRTFLRVLTQASLDADLATGRVTLGDDEAAVARDDVAVEAAVAEVLLAFDDGLFKLFLDDREVESADAVLAVTDGATALFLRLVPLAGG